MPTDRKAPKTIDEYIAGFPEAAQAALQQVRMAVREAAPDAVETIKWGMPTFVLNGDLVTFAAAAQHIGFYPGPRGDGESQARPSAPRAEQTTFRFPLDRPVPADLIRQVVERRARENAEAAATRKSAYRS